MHLPRLRQIRKGGRRGRENGRCSIRISPSGIINLAFSYHYLDRLGEAENTLHQAAARKLEIPELLLQRYDIAFLRGDQAGMEREVTLGQGNSALEDWIIQREAFVLAYSGHLQQARRHSRRAVDLARQTAQEGKSSSVRKPGRHCGRPSSGMRPQPGSARRRRLSFPRTAMWSTALRSRWRSRAIPPGAQTLANDLERRFPEDTSVRFSYVPAIRALLALHRGNL